MYRTTGTILCFDKYAILARVGSVLSARVIKFEKTPEGEPLSADCVVYFSGNVVHISRCIFGGTTRQVIEVQAHENYAIMQDFVIPHPDGLATYRIYQKAVRSLASWKWWPDGGCAFRTSAGCHDVATISRSESLCRSGRVGRQTGEVQELTNVALQTKRIMNTLVESFKQGLTPRFP
jgi:hypothetical protein